jgi:NADPH:quinone reductase-like Zn-dependent oxidoreductase
MADVGEAMRAVVLTGHGGLEQLEFRQDVPIPIPAVGEVMIEVGACGVNSTDITTRVGRNGSSWTQMPVAFPLIQGAGVAGSVVAVGPGVPEQWLGERVLIDPSIRDSRFPLHAQLVEYLGSERDGGYAEFVAVPVTNAHRIDSKFSDPELATFPCSYDTAEEMLVRVGLGKGEVIVVSGAAGGVGTALVQLAAVRGARIVAVAEAANEEQLRGLGAEEFVAEEGGDIRATIEALVGSRRVDVVADVVGGPMFEDLMQLVRRAGRYVIAGAIDGPTTRFDVRDLIYKDVEMFGVTNPTADTFARIVALIEWGRLRPVLARSFALPEVQEAQKQIMDRAQVGNFVVVP